MKAGTHRSPNLPRPPLNYAIVAGELASDPRAGRGPSGDPVVVFRIEFPVASPEQPRRLWLWAGVGVEVPISLDQADRVQRLHGGSLVLVAGQVSERWTIEDGHSCRSGFIVASLVRPDLDPDRLEELLVPGWGCR